jgi:hypothetical protein
MTLVPDGHHVLGIHFLIGMIDEQRIADPQAGIVGNMFGIILREAATVSAGGGRGFCIGGFELRGANDQRGSEAVVELMLQYRLAAIRIRNKIASREMIIIQIIKTVELWAMLGAEGQIGQNFIARLGAGVATKITGAGVELVNVKRAETLVVRQ